MVYAATNGLGVFKSTNGGVSWIAANTGITTLGVFSVAVDPSNTANVYVGTNISGVFKSTNGGASWTAVNTGLTTSPTYQVLAIDPYNPSVVYAGSDGSGLFKSINGGTSWSALNSLPSTNVQALAIDPSNTATLYAGISSGAVKSTNGGTTWNAINNGLDSTNVQALAIDPSNTSNVYAGTFGGGFFKSINGGANWTSVTGVSGSVQSLAIDPSNPSNLFAGTNGFGTFTSKTAGATWVAPGSATNQYVQSLAIDPTATTTVYAATQGAGVFKTTDGGTWLATGANSGSGVTPATTISLVSGDSQAGSVGQPLLHPFVAVVTNTFGIPVAGTNVTFAVTNGGGSLSGTQGTTDSQGVAFTTLTLGATAGIDNNSVTASVSGLSGSPVTFFASGRQAATINPLSGQNQTALTGARLANPFVVLVTDSGNFVVPGVTVTFAVAAGGGTLSSTSVITNAKGQAASFLTLGATAGFNTVTASSGSLGGSPVTFTATGLTGTATDLMILKSHTGNFIQGDTASDFYTITVINVGGTGTAGTVTVVDTLPTGLTSTFPSRPPTGGTTPRDLTPKFASGAGWSCSLPATIPITCTRNDILASGASYPDIFVGVNVDSNAPASVTNTATVSGGGDTSAPNNTANDVTTINAAPDLTVTKTHTGNFTEGQSGAIYTIRVTNSGGTATTGMVSVLDTLPTGLTSTPLTKPPVGRPTPTPRGITTKNFVGGAEWSCIPAELTCTTSAALAPGASYSDITFTVDVASNAPASLTNTATVSGGGEFNTANDTASDPTTIILVPDLIVASGHLGSFVQGQSGATYAISVANAGGLATSGTVTVTDTLPTGLTATAISGSGWSCPSLVTLTCTRSDALVSQLQLSDNHTDCERGDQCLSRGYEQRDRFRRRRDQHRKRHGQ